MQIDWGVVATFAAPVVALFIGAWVTRHFGDRPKLISYYGHLSSFRCAPPGTVPLFVNTHAVVLRNAGRQAATNVRMSHAFLPDFTIFPDVKHTTEVLTSGISDIVIPVLVPGEQITVSYLYFRPQTAADINRSIKCDQGFAQPINVLLQRQWPRWYSRSLAVLVIIGVITVLYGLYFAVLRMTPLFVH